MIRGIAKPYAARVKDGSNTITTAVSQKIFIQKVIAALVGIALDFTAPSLLSGISSNAFYILSGLSYMSSIFVNVPGIGIDGENGVTLVRNTGKVAALQEAIDGKAASLAFDDVHEVHVGISHTRW